MRGKVARLAWKFQVGQEDDRAFVCPLALALLIAAPGRLFV
jgi:hypothetical protein